MKNTRFRQYDIYVKIESTQNNYIYIVYEKYVSIKIIKQLEKIHSFKGSDSFCMWEDCEKVESSL